jgi:hypothetical protein
MEISNQISVMRRIDIRITILAQQTVIDTAPKVRFVSRISKLSIEFVPIDTTMAVVRNQRRFCLF